MRILISFFDHNEDSSRDTELPISSLYLFFHTKRSIHGYGLKEGSSCIKMLVAYCMAVRRFPSIEVCTLGKVLRLELVAAEPSLADKGSQSVSTSRYLTRKD